MIGIRLRIVIRQPTPSGISPRRPDERRLERLDEAVVAVLGELVGALAVDVQLDLAAAPAADLDLDRLVTSRASPGSRSRPRGWRSSPGPPPRSVARRARPASSIPRVPPVSDAYQPSAATTASVVGPASRTGADLGLCGVWVLEPVAGQDAHDHGIRVDAQSAVADEHAQPGHARRRRRLAEDALEPGDVAVGGQDLGIGDGLDQPARFVAGRGCLGPAGRIADPDRRRDGFRLGDRVTQHDRCRPGRLEAVHPRHRSGLLGRAIVAEAGPVGADVAGVADRDRQHVRGPAEIVTDLERGGLLPLEPMRVDRVDQRDRVVRPVDQVAHDPQGDVEVPVDGDHPRTGDERLEQLAHRDLAAGQDDHDLQPGGRAVRRRRGGGVPGRGAHDGTRPGLEGLAHGDDHAPVLEAPGRVGALDLEVQVGQAQLATKVAGVDQRRPALAEGRVRGGRTDGQEPAVALDQGRAGGHRSGLSRRPGRGWPRHRPCPGRPGAPRAGPRR